MNKKHHYIIDISLLLIITLITYWPVAFNIFSLKNDSVVQFLPFRYHLSEAIQHGFFPFWSPYLFTGFPIHADMQGMTWNPIVLLLSLFTTYNMSVLQLEVTIYLFLCGVGMYTLLKTFSFTRATCLIGAVSYMSCGFIVGSASVIPWVSSAAFLPFALAGLHNLFNTPSTSNSVKFAISISLFFVCCYPGLFIYAGYVILILVIGYFISTLRKNAHAATLNFFNLILAAFLFLLLCSPAIISYWQFLPYYARGSNINYERATTNLFPIFSVLSFIFPNTVSKPHPWIDTDISMRNSYIGLLVLVFFLTTITGKLSAKQKLILGVTVFSFLFSLGSSTPLHKWCYQLLPFVNTFRHPGTIRLFTVTGMILLAAGSIDTIFKKYAYNVLIRAKKLSLVIAAVLLLMIIYYLLKKDIAGNIHTALQGSTPKAKLDQFSFETFAVAEGLIQLGFIISFLFFITKKQIRLIPVFFLFLLNAIFFTWIAEPFTFISKVKTAASNHYIASFPEGYPLSAFSHSIKANSYSAVEGVSKYGYEKFYNKEITIQDYEITPTLNIDYQNFLRTPSLRKLFANYPVAYLADTIIKNPANVSAITGHKKVAFADNLMLALHPDSAAEQLITLQHFDPNHFTFTIQSSGAGLFNLFQEYNANWKATLNNRPAVIYKTNMAFMGIPVPPGKSFLQLTYKPTAVIYAMIVCGITLICLLLFFVLHWIQNKIRIEHAL